MRRSRMLLVIAAGFALTVVPSLHAQTSCRDECSAALQQCKRDCANAQAFDACVSNCQEFYQQCVAACE